MQIENIDYETTFDNNVSTADDGFSYPTASIGIMSTTDNELLSTASNRIVVQADDRGMPASSQFIHTDTR